MSTTTDGAVAMSYASGDRGGFECHCGAANCRGMVLGSLYSPAPPTKAPSKAAA